MLTIIKNKFISLIQLLLVMVYIVFEELIWEGIAKPIYNRMHSLKILQKVESKLENVSPSIILVLFVVLLLVVETFGIYAGMLFVSGKVLLGLSLYISKIPIAAFTFWLFRITEDKLMKFTWFKWIYEKIMASILWLKSNEMYIKTIVTLKQWKESFKKWKETYFKKDNPFLHKMKKIYTILKRTLKK